MFCFRQTERGRDGAAIPRYNFLTDLATIHFPVSLALKAEFEQAILGIVALATFWTLQVAAPRRAPAIVICGYREGGSATAWHQINLELLRRLGHLS